MISAPQPVCFEVNISVYKTVLVSCTIAVYILYFPLICLYCRTFFCVFKGKKSDFSISLTKQLKQLSEFAQENEKVHFVWSGMLHLELQHFGKKFKRHKFTSNAWFLLSWNVVSSKSGNLLRVEKLSFSRKGFSRCPNLWNIPNLASNVTSYQLPPPKVHVDWRRRERRSQRGRRRGRRLYFLFAENVKYRNKSKDKWN